MTPDMPREVAPYTPPDSPPDSRPFIAGLQIASRVLVILLPVLWMAGCSTSFSTSSAPVSVGQIQGMVHGGNQAVVGAHVYLMAATVSGVGTAGYGLASTSLLNSTQTGHSDSIGGYVLTGSGGSFNLDVVSGTNTPEYVCPSSTTQVYLYVLGGNPGAGTNNAASFMAALGPCGNLSSSTFVSVNEVTTVAAAYALAGFATDALHISIPQYVTGTTTDTEAQTGLQNAFATVNNLVNSATGTALNTTPAGNGHGYSSTVVTLANILAACVNSNGTTTNPSNCYTLFNNAGSTGGATGTIPAETATAAINIAHYPYVSSTVTSNLFALQAASGAPFSGGYSYSPNTFILAIYYTGGGLASAYSLAVDAAGNVWVTNSDGNSISKFSNAGAAISSTAGYTGGGLSTPETIAIDAAGNAWVANGTGNSLTEFSSSGVAISGSSGFTGGGLQVPYSVAIDAAGNVWAGNNGNKLSKFSSTGTPISTSSGYTGGGLNYPRTIAIDVSGNVWVANHSGNSLSEFSGSGTAISSSAGYTGGGIYYPDGFAIDGAGNLWVGNDGPSGESSLSEFSSAGAAVYSSSFYSGGISGPNSVAIDGSGNVWTCNYIGYSISKFSSTGTALSPGGGYAVASAPTSIAIDSSGNVWVTNWKTTQEDYNQITEVIGGATPVVTPVVANLISPYSAPASKP